MLQDFGSRRAAGVAPVRRHQKLPPCWTDPAPDSSKMDTLLDKAEPIGDADDSSVITYLRKGKKHCAASEREEWENMRQTVLQTQRSVKKEGQEEHQFPCSPW